MTTPSEQPTPPEVDPSMTNVDGPTGMHTAVEPDDDDALRASRTAEAPDEEKRNDATMEDAPTISAPSPVEGQWETNTSRYDKRKLKKKRKQVGRRAQRMRNPPHASQTHTPVLMVPFSLS
jgi:hypothetical protein